MKEILLPPPSVIEENENRHIEEKRSVRWTRVLYFSMITGIVSGVSGLFLGAFSYLGPPGEADSINQIGNLMIVAAFALLMLGAHALDKISERKINRKQP